MRTHAASAPGALCSTRSVGTLVREPTFSLRWRIGKMPADSVTDWVCPPAPIRRPSTVEASASVPLRASTTVPDGQRRDALQRHEARRSAPAAKRREAPRTPAA